MESGNHVQILYKAGKDTNPSILLPPDIGK